MGVVCPEDIEKHMKIKICDCSYGINLDLFHSAVKSTIQTVSTDCMGLSEDIQNYCHILLICDYLSTIRNYRKVHQTRPDLPLKFEQSRYIIEYNQILEQGINVVE